MASAKLTATQIEHEQVKLNGWRVLDERLSRQFKFPDFKTALAFVDQVGAEAERLNHHPDISFSWGRAKIEIWSHDVNGLTNRDFALASAIDKLTA